jgi:hypothetical protein
MSFMLFLLMVFHDEFPRSFLEEEGALITKDNLISKESIDTRADSYLFYSRMKFAIDKNTSVQVFLRRIAEILVFFEDLLEAVADLIKIFV